MYGSLMEKIAHHVLLFLILMLTPYLLCSLFSWSFNVFEWNWFSYTIAIIAYLMVCLGYYVCSDYYETRQRLSIVGGFEFHYHQLLSAFDETLTVVKKDKVSAKYGFKNDFVQGTVMFEQKGDCLYVYIYAVHKIWGKGIKTLSYLYDEDQSMISIEVTNAILQINVDREFYYRRF